MKRMLRELKVLMLEDVPTDAELIERELQQAKIWYKAKRVDTREDFEKALEKFAPDIILADYSLPAFDGITALRIAHGRAPDIPFIFVSGSIGEERAVEALRHGAVDYVIKDRMQRLGPAVLRAMEDVTARAERRQTDAALRVSEERFRTVASATADGVWDWNLTTNEVWLSEGVRRLFGYADAPEYVTPDWIASRLHPEDAPRINSEIREFVRSPGQLWVGKYRFRRGDERYAHVLDRLRVLRDENGKPVRAIAALSDVTERVEAERRLATQYAITRVLSEAETLEEAIPRLLEHWNLGIGADIGGLWLLDSESQRLRCHSIWCGSCLNPDEYQSGCNTLEFAPGQGLPGLVWERGESVFIPDLLADRNLLRLEAARREKLKQGFAFPIRSGKSFVGVMESLFRTPWSGDLALIRMANDLGSQIGQFVERKRAEALLQYRLKFEELVGGISTLFVELPPEEIDRGVNEALERVSRFVGVDRSYILLPRDQRMHGTHEWIAKGIPPDRHNLQNLVPGEFAWWREKLNRFETIVLNTPADLPPQAEAERQMLQRQGSHSALIVPLTHAKVSFGVFTLASQQPRKWTSEEIALVRIIGEILASALSRQYSHERRKALSRQNALILQSAGDGIFGVDPEGNTTFVNPAGAAMLGWTVEELLGRKLHDVAHYAHPDGSPYPWTDCPTYVAIHKETTERRDAEFFWRKDGSSFPVELTSTPIVDENGQRQGAVLAARDVEKRVLLERQLEQANRLSSLGRLAATIAHEFNNVLMGIQPFNELISKQAAGEPKIQKATEQIGRSIQRGKGISQQILRFTRPAQPNMQRIQLEDWTGEFAAEMREVIGQKVELRVELPSEKLMMLGDPLQLLQVFSNLVLNARDAMPNGGTVELRVEPPSHRSVFSFGIVARPEQFVHFIVQDNGPGMSSETMSKIFEPLFTTKKSGTGLGLAVSHQIVQQHGGQIFVESELGKGTTFHVFLPAASAAHAEAPGGQADPAAEELRKKPRSSSSDQLSKRDQ